jgi:hypothetical protein
LVPSDANVRAERFGAGVIPGRQLAGRTVGIVGTGTIGLRTAELFHAAGCSMIAFSRTRRERFTGPPINGRYVDSMEELAAVSDVIVLSVPLTPATRGLIGGRALAAMARRPILINTARSELVDQAALAEGLRTDRIAGAAIDVYDAEPVPANDPLLSLPRTLLTPHIGFQTAEALAELARVTTRNIGNYMSNAPVRKAIGRVDLRDVGSGNKESSMTTSAGQRSEGLDANTIYIQGSEACRNYSCLTKDVRLVGARAPLVLLVPLGAALLDNSKLNIGTDGFSILLGGAGFVLAIVSIGVALVDWHYQSAFEAIRDQMRTHESAANVEGWATVHYKERHHQGEILASYLPFWIWTAVGLIALGIAPLFTPATSLTCRVGMALLALLLAGAAAWAYWAMARKSPCGRALRGVSDSPTRTPPPQA